MDLPLAYAGSADALPSGFDKVQLAPASAADVRVDDAIAGGEGG